MKIKHLYIKKYKKFYDKVIDFNESILNEELKNLYGNIDITALIGANGSGKTTILSFIVQIFRYLQRDQSKIPSEYKLIYEIDKNVVALEYFNKSVFIEINGIKRLLLEMARRDGKNVYVKKHHQKDINISTTTFDEIRDYLPKSVVASGFDLDYEVNYHKKLICERLVRLNNQHYFSSSVGMDMSLGICKFYKKYFSDDPSLRNLFNQLNMRFTQYVKVRLKFPMIFDAQVSDDEPSYCKERICIDKNMFLHERDKSYYEMLQELKDFAWKNNFSFKSLVESIRNESFFYYYIHGEYDGGFNWKFALGQYMNSNKTNQELLEILIKHKALYINDVFISNKFEYSINTMSTGEKMIIGRLFFILSNIDNNSIVIVEEPEIHLNYLWVKHIITIFIQLLSEFSIHLLISSHNFSFINNLQSKQVLFLNDEKVASPEKPIFLANEIEIIEMFNDDYLSDNFVEDYLYRVIDSNDIKKLKFYFENLGESYIKILVFKKLKELGVINVEGHK